MSVRLETSDTPASWVLSLARDSQAEPTRGGGEADLVVAGRAEDLLLYLWGRKDIGVLERAGSGRLADGFDSWLRGA